MTFDEWMSLESCGTRTLRKCWDSAHLAGFMLREEPPAEGTIVGQEVALIGGSNPSDAVNRAVAAERERAARVCDDEARICSEAAAKHPEGSYSRDRCNAAARAAINCAKGVRSGEVVGPNVEVSGGL